MCTKANTLQQNDSQPLDVREPLRPRRLASLQAAWLALALLPAPHSDAEPLPRDGNLREACRKQVAGLYLALYDQKEKAKSYRDLLAQTNVELKAGLNKAKAEFLQSEKRIAQSALDLQLSLEHEGKASQVAAIEKNIQENLELAQKAQEAELTSTRELKAVTENLNKIFTINPIKGDGDSYKFSVSYQSPCPSYHDSCPLPAKEAKLLQSLFGDKTPDVCVKYANFLQW